jgi:FKBP-type peptidyl-prolyl cis-trans isomerase
MSEMGRRTMIIMVVLAAIAVALTFLPRSGPDRTAERMQDPAWQQQQALALTAPKASDGWQTMDGGLRWRRIKGTGAGKHPTIADTVTLHYAGTLTDGTEFDSSYARHEPATFPLADLITAWQMAVPQMGIGDTIEIVSPSDLAYGPDGKGEIPGGATLLFKVELLGIEGQ